MSTLTVNGTDRWANLQQETLSVEDQLNARNVCSFTLIDNDGSARPRIGEVVVLTIDGTVRFAGTVDSYSEKNITSRFTNPHRSYRVKCVDYNQFCDRHIVADVYENVEMIDIIQDVVTQKLYADGVTLDPATPDGPTIEYYSANYISAAQVFDDLSEMTGYFWYIGYDKVLHFIDRTTLSAPYDLTQSAAPDLVESLSVEHSRDQYRNVQYIRGGMAVTDAILTETFKGDGETRTFTTSLPVASAPTISVNTGSGYVVKTRGIRQVDTGYDWYWQENSNEISQDSSGTVLGTTHTLKVEYYGYYPLVDAARLQSEVDARISVEGGSGLYESVEYREDITSSSLSTARAEGLLALFGDIQSKISFDTYATGWQAGQLLYVDRSEHDLAGLYLISEVTLSHDGLTDYRYAVTAVSGSLVENWVAFFKRLAQEKRRSTRRSNEVINLLRLAYEDVDVTEAFDTPDDVASVLGEVASNGTSVTSLLDKHFIGFSVIGPLAQLFVYSDPTQDLPIGLTESTFTAGTNYGQDSAVAVHLTETATLSMVTP